MKKNFGYLGLTVLVTSVLGNAFASSEGGMEGGGGTRFYYDTLKIKALVSSTELEMKLFKVGGMTLDAIKIQAIDNERRKISYEVRSGKCKVLASLTWEETEVGVNYRVVSVSDGICKKETRE